MSTRPLTESLAREMLDMLSADVGAFGLELAGPLGGPHPLLLVGAPAFQLYIVSTSLIVNRDSFPLYEFALKHGTGRQLVPAIVRAATGLQRDHLGDNHACERRFVLDLAQALPFRPGSDQWAKYLRRIVSDVELLRLRSQAVVALATSDRLLTQRISVERPAALLPFELGHQSEGGATQNSI